MDAHQQMDQIFGRSPALIGMLHVPALPGTPASRLTLEEIVRQMVTEARLLQRSGFDGLAIENMHDRPYLRQRVGPEITAAMAVVGAAVRDAVDLPMGVQVLAGANREALAVALACGAQFVRVEGFVFAHLGDEGWHEADAGALLRYRRQLGAEHIRIFADIKKKHSSHAVTTDIDLVETAKAAQFFLADGLIVSGMATGEAAAPEDVGEVAEAVDLPILVGSGVTVENVARFVHADGLIVGTSLKVDGLWYQDMDPGRVEALSRAFDEAVSARR